MSSKDQQQMETAISRLTGGDLWGTRIVPVLARRRVPTEEWKAALCSLYKNQDARLPEETEIIDDLTKCLEKLVNSKEERMLRRTTSRRTLGIRTRLQRRFTSRTIGRLNSGDSSHGNTNGIDTHTNGTNTQAIVGDLSAQQQQQQQQQQHAFAIVTEPMRISLDTMIADVAGVDKSRVQNYLRQIAEIQWELEQKQVAHVGCRLRDFDSDKDHNIMLHALHKLALSNELIADEGNYSQGVMPPELARHYLAHQHLPKPRMEFGAYLKQQYALQSVWVPDTQGYSKVELGETFSKFGQCEDITHVNDSSSTSAALVVMDSAESAQKALHALQTLNVRAADVDDPNLQTSTRTLAAAIWGFGRHVYRLSNSVGRHIFAENVKGEISRRDLETTAYGWEQQKLALTNELVWPDAADLALSCLQTKPGRRPVSFEKILEHPFLQPVEPGTARPRPLEQTTETTETSKQAMALFARQLHSAIDEAKLVKIKQLFDEGKVQILTAMVGLSVLPLHRAAMRGIADTLKFLLDEVPALRIECLTEIDPRILNETINCRDHFGFTALHWAAAYNRKGAAEMLLDRGCDPSVLNNNGKTAWDVAEMFCGRDVLDLFEERGGCNEAIVDAQILHVRGIQDLTEETLKEYFNAKSVATRSRQQHGVNTSWALVVMDSPEAATKQLQAAHTDHPSLDVRPYGGNIAVKSTGGLAAVLTKALMAAGMSEQKTRQDRIKQSRVVAQQQRAAIVQETFMDWLDKADIKAVGTDFACPCQCEHRICRLHRIFSDLDTSNDGRIDTEEFLEGMHRAGSKLSRTELVDVVARADVHFDGVLQHDEFARLFAPALTRLARTLEFQREHELTAGGKTKMQHIFGAADSVDTSTFEQHLVQQIQVQPNWTRFELDQIIDFLSNKCRTIIRRDVLENALPLHSQAQTVSVAGADAANEHTLLRKEWKRRARRPDVPPVRDDIELDHTRLIYWNIEPFENWEKIAEGGFGQVFLVKNVSPAICVRDRQFDEVVVKVPKGGGEGSVEEGGVNALTAEVESLSRLDHEHVVLILGMAEGAWRGCEEGTRWMMVLEYCQSDLNKLLYSKNDKDYYSKPLMGKFCRQIVSGMSYVHGMEHKTTKQKHMHLDLKPENILLANKGTKLEPIWIAKIGDFGWIPELKQDDWTGTPLYMAPEFAIRNLNLDQTGVQLPKVGPKADVFSFGMLLWEMFERQTPLDGMTVSKGIYAPRCSCTQVISLDGVETHIANPCQKISEGETALCLRTVSEWMVGKNQMPDFSANFPALLRLLVEACWAETPAARPTFANIQKALKSTEAAEMKRRQRRREKEAAAAAAVADAEAKKAAVANAKETEFQHSGWRAARERVLRLSSVATAAAAAELERKAAELEREAAEAAAAADAKWLEPPSPPTVQEWLDTLGLGSKLELLESYLQEAHTIVDTGFRQFVEDEHLDNYVDEMVEEDDDGLTEDEAAKLKEALRSLNGADPEAGQEPQDSWHALCKLLNFDLAAGEEAGDAAARVQHLEIQLAKQNKLTEELQAQLAEKVEEVQQPPEPKPEPEPEQYTYHSGVATHDYPHEMETVEAENKKLQDESHELKTPREEAGRGDAAIPSIETEANKTREQLQPTIPTRDHKSAPEPRETR
jgi:serine/threonine protein kinase